MHQGDSRFGNDHKCTAVVWSNGMICVCFQSQNKNLPVRDVDHSVLRLCELLKDFSAQGIDCLKGFVQQRCLDFVCWLRENMTGLFFNVFLSQYILQSETQSTHAESTHKGINQCLKQTQQQRPESPVVTHPACKYKVHKLQQRYILSIYHVKACASYETR